MLPRLPASAQSCQPQGGTRCCGGGNASAVLAPCQAAVPKSCIWPPTGAVWCCRHAVARLPAACLAAEPSTAGGGCQLSLAAYTVRWTACGDLLLPWVV